MEVVEAVEDRATITREESSKREAETLTPELLAATKRLQSDDRFDDDDDDDTPTVLDGTSNARPEPKSHHDYFDGLQWSADGTTLLLSSAVSHRLASYILPPGLLTPPDPQGYHDLNPYCIHSLPEPIYATAIHPAFSLSNPESYYLASLRALPIRLLSPFAPGLVASYPLVSRNTEAWIAPHSLLCASQDSGTFFAGSDGRVSLFDMWRDGEEPFASIQTGRRRRRAGKVNSAQFFSDEGVGSRGVIGIVSALAMNNEKILAAGSFNGGIALLDPFREEGSVGTLPLPADTMRGVTALKFQPQPARGDYLVVASRCSNAVHVFDLRNAGAVMATLRGRKAMTQQRLGIEISADGEVMAGGTDGVVRAWDGIGMQEGEVECSREWQLHQDAVGGLGLYPDSEMTIAATCAGSRIYEDSDVSRREKEEAGSLKVWTC